MIDVITICQNAENANTYIVGNDNEVIIIDPANSFSSINTAIRNRRVLGIFLTHGHYDHFRNLLEILKKYDIKCYLHEKAFLKITDLRSSCAMFFGVKELKAIDISKVCFVKDQDILKLSPNLEIKVETTPGHTDCSISLIIDKMIFSGDTIFLDGVGRTDLPTSKTIALVSSLKKLLNNESDCVIYPGHGNSTTVDYERKNNSFYIKTK